MVLYAIIQDWDRKIKIGFVEVEEKEKTYRVINTTMDIYMRIIKKDIIDRYLDRKVFSLDREKAKEVYKNGLERSLKEETERHFRTKNQILDQLKIFDKDF